ncbi:MAG TPA: hypothetical protein VF510_09625 [Ktedonobacterales bacterium]
MATDTRTNTSLTLADLCQAIARGNLPYALRDDHYYVKVSDVRRLRSSKSARRHALPPDLLMEAGIEPSSLNVGCSA